MSSENAQDEVYLEDEDDNGQANKYMLFSLQDEVFGIAISDVTEIIEMQKITAVPDLPDFIRGVINLRGRVVPAMDLRLRFGMRERDYDDRTCIIIASVSSNQMGFIVDTVAEVHDIAENKIEPPPSLKEDGSVNRYISGLGKVDDRITILVDVKKLLSSREIEEVMEAVE